MPYVSTCNIGCGFFSPQTCACVCASAALRTACHMCVPFVCVDLMFWAGGPSGVQVWKGLLTDRQHQGTSAHEEIVAAKLALANDGSEGARIARADLIKEATVMGQVSYHANVVSLIGVVTRGDPLIVVVSYCEHGDIKHVLGKAAADGTPWSEARKLRMCHEVASGMAHLVECQIVHRDLASRNVLLTSSNACKVADFGLSRFTASENYYRSQQGTFVSPPPPPTGRVLPFLPIQCAGCASRF